MGSQRYSVLSTAARTSAERHELALAGSQNEIKMFPLIYTLAISLGHVERGNKRNYFF